MNPQPELTYRIETLAAEQNRRAIELQRSIHEHTGTRATRPVRGRIIAAWRRARGAAVVPEASAPVPCSGSRAHA